jgi:hypothetical protein
MVVAVAVVVVVVRIIAAPIVRERLGWGRARKRGGMPEEAAAGAQKEVGLGKARRERLQVPCAR